MTAALALGLILVPLLTLRPGPAEPTPSPGIVPIAGEISTVPKVAVGAEANIRDELTTFVRHLYEMAFLTRDIQASPSHSPNRTPDLYNYFSDRARSALGHRRDVFEARDLEIQHGQLTFKGVVTLNETKPLEALLEVDLRATGETQDGPTVTLRQHGTLLAIRSSTGWRVSGFELKLEMQPAVVSAVQNRT